MRVKLEYRLGKPRAALALWSSEVVCFLWNVVENQDLLLEFWVSRDWAGTLLLSVEFH